jgi:hypothetical protein
VPKGFRSSTVFTACDRCPMANVTQKTASYREGHSHGTV